MDKSNQLNQIKFIRKKREERAAKNMRESKKAYESLEKHLRTVRLSLDHFRVWREFQENGFYDDMGKGEVSIADIEYYRLQLTKMVVQENEIIENLEKFEELLGDAQKKKTSQ